MVDAASPIFVDGRGEDPGQARPRRGGRANADPRGNALRLGNRGRAGNGAAEIVDPRPYATGKIRETFEKYPGIGALLPAVGYGDEQVRDLEATIRQVPCDLVIVATPVDLTRIIRIEKPMVRVRYELKELGSPDLEEILKARLEWRLP